MTAPLTRDQIQRGKNTCPASRLDRAKKGASLSPWSKSPSATTKKAAAAFAANRQPTKVSP